VVVLVGAGRVSLTGGVEGLTRNQAHLLGWASRVMGQGCAVIDSREVSKFLSSSLRFWWYGSIHTWVCNIQCCERFLGTSFAIGFCSFRTLAPPITKIESRPMVRAHSWMDLARVVVRAAIDHIRDLLLLFAYRA
jgi:hypothetical protein